MRTIVPLLKTVTLTLLLLVVSLAQAAEPRTVRLGLTESQTGEYKDLSQSFVEGVKFWASDLVDRGGNPIDLVIYDDESNPERAAELYEQLITEDQVDLLIGPFSSTLVEAVVPVAEQHGFPIIVEATAPDVYSHGYKNVFGIYTPANYNMLSVMDMAVDNGVKTLALANQRSDFPAAVAEGVRVAAPGKGLSIVFEDSYPVDNPDMDALARKMAGTSPDLIILGAYLEDSIAFVKALKATGYAPKMLAISGAPAVDEFGRVLGEDADGVIATTQWMRDGRIPGSFDFGYRYRKEFGHYPSYNAAGGYAAGQILEAAVRLAQPRQYTDPQKLRVAIREQLATMKFQSLLGNYRVDDAGQQADNPIYVVQWQWPHRSLIAPVEIARWQLKFPFPAWEGR